MFGSSYSKSDRPKYAVCRAGKDNVVELMAYAQTKEEADAIIEKKEPGDAAPSDGVIWFSAPISDMTTRLHAHDDEAP